MDEGIGYSKVYLGTDFLINLGITFWNIGTSNFLFYVKGNLFMLILFIYGYVIYIINLFRFCLIMFNYLCNYKISFYIEYNFA